MPSLIFAKVGGLGDCLTVLPTIAALRNLAPERPLTVLTSPVGKAVMEGAVPGTRWVTMERSGLSGIAGLRAIPGLLRRLPRGAEALLSPDECTAVHLALRLRSRRTTGFDGDIARGERWLRQRLKLNIDRSVYDVAMDLARMVLKDPELPLQRVSPRFGAVPRSWLAARGLDRRVAYGVIHPAASGAPRIWAMPPQLVEDLTRATGLTWVVIRQGDGLSLDALGALLAGARAFVGLHSGPLHLAAALGTPWVALPGPTAPEWDPPWTDVPGIALRLGPDCQPCARFGSPVRDCSQGVPPPCLGVRSDMIVSAVQGLVDART